eukprot:m.170186 g.170186  ORF g.170186 m.170186 type:complete len:948 (+) comp14521_c0_seq2:998-3841(+)
MTSLHVHSWAVSSSSSDNSSDESSDSETESVYNNFASVKEPKHTTDFQLDLDMTAQLHIDLGRVPSPSKQCDGTDSDSGSVCGDPVESDLAATSGYSTGPPSSPTSTVMPALQHPTLSQLASLSVQSGTPTSVMLVAFLLEKLCTVFERRQDRARLLFKMIISQLSMAEALPEACSLEKLMHLREQYNMAFTTLLAEAQEALDEDDSGDEIDGEYPSCAPPWGTPEGTCFQSMLKPSRFHDEFLVEQQLGTGGFGQVLQVKNKLDGIRYAVKKVPVWQNDGGEKTLREVTTLAALEHPNIIRYHAAWIERNSLNPIRPTANSDTPGKVTEIVSEEESDAYCTCDRSTPSSPMSSLSTPPVFGAQQTGSPLAFKLGSDSATDSSSPSSDDEDEHEHEDVEGDSEGTPTKARRKMARKARVNLRPRSPSNTSDDTALFTQKPQHEPKHEKHGSCDASEPFTIDPSKLDDPLAAVKPLLMGGQRRSRTRCTSVCVKCGRWRDSGTPSRASPTKNLNPPKTSPQQQEPGSTVAKHRPHPLVFPSRRALEQEADSVFMNGEEEEDEDESDGDVTSDMLRAPFVLFIQMQLCERTLFDWLQSRKESPGVLRSPILARQAMSIFKQIVEGVAYLHSRNIVHRDLKPRNIFLNAVSSGTICVKLGDFGLATPMSADVNTPPITSPALSRSPSAPNFSAFNLVNGYGRSFTIGDEGSVTRSASTVFADLDVSTLSQQLQDAACAEGSSSSAIVRRIPSDGVGTATYASPEQLHGEEYTTKADMYSLGIILFELFNVFSTEMERGITLMHLKRRGDLPPDFVKLYTTQAAFVLCLTNTDPRRRLPASALLDPVKGMFESDWGESAEVCSISERRTSMMENAPRTRRPTSTSSPSLCIDATLKATLHSEIRTKSVLQDTLQSQEATINAQRAEIETLKRQLAEAQATILRLQRDQSDA